MTGAFATLLNTLPGQQSGKSGWLPRFREPVMNQSCGEKPTAGINTRKPYPNGVSDEAWELVAQYLTLLRLEARQRHHDVRAAFNVSQH